MSRWAKISYFVRTELEHVKAIIEHKYLQWKDRRRQQQRRRQREQAAEKNPPEPERLEAPAAAPSAPKPLQKNPSQSQPRPAGTAPKEAEGEQAPREDPTPPAPHEAPEAENRWQKLLHTRIPTPFRLLDVYMLRGFLMPLLVCFCGFVAIWLIFDLNDNLPDFLDARVPLLDVLAFYGTQLPQFALEAIPVSLLLGLLFTLSKMSRSNELVSMLSAGISIPRLLVPVFVVGLLATLISLGLSYKLAPWATAEREARLDAIVSGEDTDEATLSGQVFRNRYENRTWFVRKMPLDGSELSDVVVIQQDPRGEVLYWLNIRSATYNPITKAWNIYRGLLYYPKEDGTAKRWEYLRDTYIYGLSETPERIVSANMNPEWMGVPAIREYLRYNADFPDKQLAPFRTYLAYRWAWPWVCMVVVLIAAPLGMAFSRGGVLSNVATSIFIIAGVFISREIFLALGQSNAMAPWLAAWLPNIIFGSLGLYLLYLRSTNRELPKLNLYNLYELLVRQGQKRRESAGQAGA
jgi:LPS export ABC transporter permease LptG